ncbi:MAG: hypothetical protein HOH14_06520 [Gammaproteobacteria bacterium]|jgi:hypothetical protein|nr:hypothetical protein [Gammaproteobacteria bacterium]MBT6043129.1 hypothetical protein [Gammaproteobacteria bacterium]
MKTGSAFLSLLLLLLWNAAALAQPPVTSSNDPYTQAQYLDLINSYVEKTVNIYDGSWAYTYITDDKLDMEKLARRVDPSKSFLQSDQIISINGSPPSLERQSRHERRMQRRLQRRQNTKRSIVEEERAREGSEKERFLAMIIPESLHLVKQEGYIHTLEFKGMEDDRKNIYKHLIGTLVLDTKNEFIRELQVRITQPFSPFFIMRIHSGFFSLRFALNNEGLPIQSDATWQLDGHILYLRDLDRNEELNWFDIEKVIPHEEQQRVLSQ